MIIPLSSKLKKRSKLRKYVKPRTMRFPRLQVTMTHNQRLRITFMQILQQTVQRTLLCLGSGVAGSLAVMGKPTHVSHPDRVPVMVFAMRPHHLFRPSHLNGTIGRNHIVVAAAYPSQRTMIAVDVRHPQGTARPIGGAVHDNQGDCSHGLRTVARQRHRQRQSESFQSHESHRARCSSSSSSYPSFLSK